MNRRLFAMVVGGLLLVSAAAIAADKTLWEVYCPKCHNAKGPFEWDEEKEGRRPSVGDLSRSGVCRNQVGYPPKGCGANLIVRRLSK
jgi:hypothetical protein